MRMNLGHLPVCLILAACGEWPDVPVPDGGVGRGPWPELKPVSELFPATPAAAVEGDAEAARLAARAEALQRRASVLRTPVEDQDDFDALRARIGG